MTTLKSSMIMVLNAFLFKMRLKKIRACESPGCVYAQVSCQVLLYPLAPLSPGSIPPNTHAHLYLCKTYYSCALAVTVA